LAVSPGPSRFPATFSRPERIGQPIQIRPLSREVCLNLALLDFASDPADELIASTSLTYQVPLMTRDDKIRSSTRIKLA
jgi:PIN domain nuclease of toxin-antitoxin system